MTLISENAQIELQKELTRQVTSDDPYNEHKAWFNAKYDELFNAGSQVDVLDCEAEYGFDFKAVDAHHSTPDCPDTKSTSPLLNNDDVMETELHIIYKKFILWTALIIIMSLATLIVAQHHGFYNWNGITFNSFAVLVGMYGILITLCFSENTTKLKNFLVYFVIALVYIVTVFVLAMIYAVLVPVHVANAEGYSDGIVVAVAISGAFGVILWTIFVLFYIDICARACLKRGRIDCVIVSINSVFWNRLYRFVIWFRLRFRTLRRILTAMTGIHCIKGQERKLHEEQLALAVLGDDGDDERYECTMGFDSEHFKRAIGLIVFAALLAPLVLYGLLVACLFHTVKCVAHRCGVRIGDYDGALLVFGGFGAMPLIYLVWWSPFGICPQNLFNTDEFPNEWNWNAQCMAWDYALLIFKGQSSFSDS
eukprot:631744_1